MKQAYNLLSVSIFLIILFFGSVLYAQSGMDKQLAILKAAQQEMNDHSPQLIGTDMRNYHKGNVSFYNIPNLNRKEKMFQSTTVLPNGWIMKEMLFQQWFNESWSDFMKYVFTYNSNNDVIEQLSMNWSGSSWINSTRNVLMYDDNRSIIKMVEQEWATTDWQDVKKDTVIYDITGRATEQLTQMWLSDTWINSQKLLMTYDTVYYLSEVLQQNWVSNTWVDTLKDSRSLDSSGNVLDWVRQNWVGGAWRYVWYYTYTYNQNGKITEQLQQNWESNEWVNVMRQTYTYDMNGYLTQITGNQWSGTSWGNGWVQTNSYDQNGNQSESVSVFWFRFEWRNTSRISYTWQEITDVKNNESIVNDYSLSANYPNPFNPKTIINYQLPIENWVTLKVFDLLGREVATLVNEKKRPGEYSVTWNADGLPSGVYFYQLIAVDFSHPNGQIFLKTMKMVVTK